MKLELVLDTPVVSPGGGVSGRVEVRDGGPSRKLTLTVALHERAQETGAIAYSSDSVILEGDLTSGQTIPFSFTLPEQAPPSVKAEHSELFWELAVRSDNPGLDRLALARLEVVAAPA